ncbi:MAG: hypothetical protein ACLFTP_08130, partial [Rhodosalinus sp.]
GGDLVDLVGLLLLGQVVHHVEHDLLHHRAKSAGAEVSATAMAAAPVNAVRRMLVMGYSLICCASVTRHNHSDKASGGRVKSFPTGKLSFSRLLPRRS